MMPKLDRSRIPESTPECLIIPAYNDKLGFKVKGVLPQLPVAAEQIEDTIFHASKLCQQVRCEKSRVEQDDPLSTEKFYITSSWVLFVVGLVLFVLGLQYEDLKSTLTSIGTIFIATPALISVVIVIISITKQPILIDLEKECLLRLNQYLERQNAAYKKKGLHWSVGDECMWLQLESI